MKRALGVLLAALAVTAAPAAFAKGETTRIQIKGPGLPQPLEIAAPQVVRNFSIWNGPGVTAGSRPVRLEPGSPAGTFIDWSKGKVMQRPQALSRFEVVFQVRLDAPPDEKQRNYAVLYEFDRPTPGGYIYLPGSTDPKYSSNVALILHGVEGNWFHSSAAWERLIRPMIEAAQRARPVSEDDAVAVASNAAPVRTTAHRTFGFSIDE